LSFAMSDRRSTATMFTLPRRATGEARFLDQGVTSALRA
jgi:hypothetical protein